MPSYKNFPPRTRGPEEDTAKKFDVKNVGRFVKENDKVVLQRIDEMVLGPSGWSAGRCLNGHFLTEPYPGTAPAFFTCECGARADDDRIAVRHASVKLLRNANHARDAIWFHVSPSPVVFVNEQDDLMHWGEFDTVMHHFMRRAHHAPRIRYLYSATLAPGTMVGGAVLVENENVDQHKGLADVYEQQGPTRYLNTQERHGSISLVARKKDLTVYQAYDLFQGDEKEIQLP